MIYRNHPRWDLLKLIQNKYPNIPIICDPSHIAGNRKYVKKIASLACEKNISGLMIEVHNNPKIALSDKKQQIDIIQFGALCKYLREST